MAQLLSAGTGKPGTEDLLLATQADTEGWYGKLKNAHDLTPRDGFGPAQRRQRDRCDISGSGCAARSGIGKPGTGARRSRCRREAGPEPRCPGAGYTGPGAGRRYASGEETGGRTRPDTAAGHVVQRYWLPTIRAAVALERKDPKRAIELLKVADPIELGQPTGLAVYLCPAYLRGEAYLMLHNGSAAAAEFQKFIDHHGLVAKFPWGALARLGLARAYAMQGNTVKARAAYEDFLTLWKDADPDIPILKEAKTEYAKLQ